MSSVLGNARRSLSGALDPVMRPARRMSDRRESRTAMLLVLLVVLLVYPRIDSDPSHIDTAVATEVNVLLALGLNIVIGYAGLLDLGYAAFFAIGAYSLATLASAQFPVTGHSFSSAIFSFGSTGIHTNFFVMIPVAAIIAALCGVLFGAPTLRLRGDYLAIVTLGFGEIVPKVIQNLGPGNTLGLPNITNGVNNITGIDTPPDVKLLGINAAFGGNDSRPWYFLGLIVIVVSVIIIRSLRDSRLGRAWAAIREDEIAAAHMGINITRTRLAAFGLGAAFSGFGGVIEASRVQSVSASQFSFNISIFILIMVIVGGMGNIPGVILGAFIISYLDLMWLAAINDQVHSWGVALHTAPSLIGGFGTWLAGLNLISARPLVLGIILLIMMLVRPQGLWPSSTRARELRPETSEVQDEEDAELYAARAE